MKKRKNIITVAIDSPAGAGAGTQAKLIAKHFNLQQLDTGRIYRLVGKLKLKNPKKLISFISDRLGHDKRYAINYNKLKHELHWSPKFNFHNSLSETIDWYIDNLD